MQCISHLTKDCPSVLARTRPRSLRCQKYLDSPRGFTEVFAQRASSIALRSTPGGGHFGEEPRKEARRAAAEKFIPPPLSPPPPPPLLKAQLMHMHNALAPGHLRCDRRATGFHLRQRILHSIAIATAAARRWTRLKSSGGNKRGASGPGRRGVALGTCQAWTEPRPLSNRPSPGGTGSTGENFSIANL